MKYNQYRFKFYLNAAHSIFLNGVLGDKHPHTWEITINTIKINDSFVIFNDVEKKIDKYLQGFQDIYLNDTEPFNKINPTLENICVYFKETLGKLLSKNGWVLLSIEISETPTRSYIIDVGDEVKYESAYEDNTSQMKYLKDADRKSVV